MTKSQKLTKSKSPTTSNVGATEFLTSKARIAFTQLRKASTEAPILQQFDPECHIWIETDASGYAISGVLSQLTSQVLLNSGDIAKSKIGHWHPMAYFSRKMIPAETKYETHDGELLTIVKTFKTWRHYLKSCKQEVLVLTNHNNLCRLMDTKSLSSRQVQWAQELSRYHFRIDYCQGKANGAADALFPFPYKESN